MQNKVLKLLLFVHYAAHIKTASFNAKSGSGIKRSRCRSVRSIKPKKNIAGSISTHGDVFDCRIWG